jgi:hypothetical protein
MERAAALEPTGAQVIECLGCTSGPNPVAVDGLVLLGIAMLIAAGQLLWGFGLPSPILLLVAVWLVGPFLHRRRGLIVTDGALTLTGWRILRGEPSLVLRSVPKGDIDFGLRALGQYPVTVAGTRLWMTEPQCCSLGAAIDQGSSLQPV